MSDEETKGEIVLTEEKRLYEVAKRRYEEAGDDLDEARNALQKWKAKHGDENDRYRELDQRVNNATQNLQITDQALQNAERRWKDARAASPGQVPSVVVPIGPEVDLRSCDHLHIRT